MERLTFEIDDAGKPRFFFPLGGNTAKPISNLLGSDGRIYRGRKNIQWTGQWWYARLGYRDTSPVVRRDKLNNPRAIAALRWCGLSRVGALCAKFKSAAEAIRAIGTCYYVENSNTFALTADDDLNVEEKNLGKPDDIVAHLATIPSGPEWEAGERWKRIGKAIERQWQHNGIIAEVLNTSLMLHVEVLHDPSWRKWDHDAANVTCIVNGQHYPMHVSRYRERDRWPHPSDIMLDLDSPANDLTKHTITLYNAKRPDRQISVIRNC